MGICQSVSSMAAAPLFNELMIAFSAVGFAGAVFVMFTLGLLVTSVIMMYGYAHR
jgi:hypothetical protein